MGTRLKSGRAGELIAERWFLANDWHMVRTQPAIEILGSKPGKFYGRIYTVRMVGQGGVPDYTGYEGNLQIPAYRAVEVKEATGDTMPCSRLDKAQRAFLSALPDGCAWVGILWVETGKFEMFPFKGKGSYQRR